MDKPNIMILIQNCYNFLMQLQKYIYIKLIGKNNSNQDNNDTDNKNVSDLATILDH